MWRTGIRVLLVGNQHIVRESIRKLLDVDTLIDLIGVAVDGSEANLIAQANSPDVILLDLEFMEEKDVEAICLMGLNSSTDILVLTEFGIKEDVTTAIRLGGLGYLSKSVSYAELRDIISRVFGGEAYLSPRGTSALISWLKSVENSKKTPLSKREVEVVRYVVRGLSTKEIATILQIKPSTVRQHTCNIFSKLNMSNRTQLVRYAIDSGIVDLGKTSI